MKRRILALTLCLLASFEASYAASPRLAVGDFTVTSANPQLAFVGKGLAEMLATDLAISKRVLLIDRERRNALLGEMEFSLSAGAESQMQAGRLLAADYLVVGSVVDMGGQVLVTCSMLKVETGEVVWTDRSLGALSGYDALSRKLAASALAGLGLEAGVADAAPPKPMTEARAAKMEEAIVAFSKAVDSVDRQDRAEAARQIAVAKAIDPANAAVASLFDRLVSGSPRFQVELDRYVPSYNPATLGFLDGGSLYEWVNTPLPWISYLIPFSGSIQFNEISVPIRVGVNMPIGGRMGLSAEVMWNSSSYFLDDNGGGDVLAGHAGSVVEQVSSDLGASIGAGYRLSDTLAVGMAARVDSLSPGTGGLPSSIKIEDVIPGTMGMFFGASLGLAAWSIDRNLGGDIELTWSNLPAPYVSLPIPGSLSRGNVPLVLATGFTAALLERKLFVNLRAIGDFSILSFREFVFRGIPGLEWWPARWIALRAAYDFTGVYSADGSNSGSGFMSGISLVLGKFDISANYIDRYRAYRLFPDLGHKGDQSMLIGVVWNGLGPRGR